MMPNPSSLRKIRTFADDIRRAQGESGVEIPTALGASGVAKTIGHHSTPPARTAVPVSNISIPSKITAHIPAQPSVHTDDQLDIRHAEKNAEEGTIITEHKAEGWSFSRALRDSLFGWWSETLESIDKTKDMPKVAPSFKRATIVRAASVKSKFAPQNDHDVLVDRLKTFAKTPPEDKTFKAAAPAKEMPHWSHVEEEEKPTPTGTEEIILPTSVKQPRGVTIGAPRVVAEPTPLPPPEPVSLAVSEPVPAPEVPTPNEWAETENFENNLRTTINTAGTQSFEDLLRKRALKRRELEEEIVPQSSPWIAYAGGAAVGIVMLILVVTVGFALLNRGDSETTVTNALFFTPAKSVAVPVEGSGTALLQSLTTKVAGDAGRSGDLSYYYLVYPSDPGNIPLPTQAFVDLVTLRAPGAFLRTLEKTMMLGAYISTPNAPYIVLRTRDRDAALGGMLFWEQYMSTDLSPLFGQSTAGTWSDEVLAGMDVRVLSNADGEMILLYAFINPDTIAIATKAETLGALKTALEQ